VKKKLVVILAGLIVTNLFCINTTRASTLYVGSGEQYTNIQDAISAANEDDVIIVSDGIYYENIVINKQIVLDGIDYPIISGRGGTVLTITADDCTVNGFNLTDGGSWPSWPAAGIWIKSNGNRVEDNIIHHNRVGICLSDANNNIITSNHIYSNDNDGVTLGDSLSSGSHYNTISKNNMSSNGEYGIGMWRSSNNNITMNTISKNGYESPYGGSGVYLSSSYNNVYLNNFENNYRDAYPLASTNLWNSSDKLSYTYKSTSYSNYLGNYWKRYMGSDANNDGIGDSPHAISGATVQDHFPLVYPWNSGEYQLALDADTSQPTLDMTTTGFYYPTGVKPTRDSPLEYGYDGAVSYYQYSGWLARGDKDGDKNGWSDYGVPDAFHLAQDIEGDKGDEVYAIADGVIKWVSTNGWGKDTIGGNSNYGYVVQHSSTDGEFFAVYGHVKPLLAGLTKYGEVNVQVTAGQPFAKLEEIWYQNDDGTWYRSSDHLHFGIRQKVEMPPPAPYGIMRIENNWTDPNSEPENTNEFVDPINWIETKIPGSPSASDGRPSTGNGDDTGREETPGFELLFFVVAIAFVLLWKRKRD